MSTSITLSDTDISYKKKPITFTSNSYRIYQIIFDYTIDEGPYLFTFETPSSFFHAFLYIGSSGIDNMVDIKSQVINNAYASNNYITLDLPAASVIRCVSLIQL